MTLYVVVVAGPGSGARHPVKKDLVRVGSAAGCEICIAGERVPAHALSLEISGENCRVYNRTDRAISCAGKSISAAGSGTWPLNGDLEIVPGLVLRIEHGDAATASARTAWEEYPSGDIVLPTGAETTSEKKAAAAKPAKPSQSVAQLVITVCCLAGCAMLLWHKYGPKPSAVTQRTVVTLNEVLDQLHAQKTPPWPQVQQAIQEAYRLDRSGDAAGARKRYARVVQLILARQSSPPATTLSESGDLSAAERSRLQDVASQLPEGLDRSVFIYAMNRL